jgi:hypothetical protein
LQAATITTGAPATETDRLARFNDVAGELQTLVNQSGWTQSDKTRLINRVQTILTDLTDPHLESSPSDAAHDDIATATERELFAILDGDLGP